MHVFIFYSPPSQHTLPAILPAARNIIDLPLQRPHLDPPDHIHQLKPARG